MKQKIFSLFKNKWVWISIAILFLIVGIIFFVSKKPEKIFSYIPQNVDQAFVIKMHTKDTLFYKKYLQKLPGNLENLFASMDIVVITQKTIDTLTQNLVFVQAKPSFKPQDLLDSLNSSGEIQYIYQKLENNLYVFGMPETLQYLSFDTHHSFFSDKKLDPVKHIVLSSEISFFSHLSNNLAANQLTPFVQDIEYFIYGIDMQGEKMNMEAHLLYKSNKTLDKNYKFKPLFKNYINDKSLFFLELGKLTEQLGIKKETMLTNLQALFSLWGITTLTVDDYATIYTTLSNNVGILIGESNNFFGVGLALIFRNSDFFSVVSKILPKISSSLSTIPLFSGMQTSLINNPQKQGFVAQIGGIQNIGLYAEKRGKDTLLVLGDLEIQEQDTDVKYSSQTLGYFNIHFSPLLKVYKKFKTSLALFSPLGGSVNQEDFSFFENKTLAGQIISSEKGITLKAVLQ